MPITRRGFLSTLTVTAMSTTGILAMPTAANAAGRYKTIDPPLNTASAESVEVLEFFWLGCPHCYSLEPNMLAWEKNMPANVSFVREAPPLNSSWEQHSRGFYAAQLMGHENAFVEAMFAAIHQNKKRMRSPGDIAELASGLGMDEDKFKKTMKSFAVQTKMNRSIQLARGAGITGVPSILINGKYLTSASLAGGNAGIIDVINETVAIEKAEMGLN
jgi:thiol:disulfide interchange protein DsbA